MKEHHHRGDHLLQEPEIKCPPGYVKPRIQQIEKRLQSRATAPNDESSSHKVLDNDDNNYYYRDVVMTPQKSQHQQQQQQQQPPVEQYYEHPSTPQQPSHQEEPTQGRERFHFLSPTSSSSSSLPSSSTIQQFESLALQRQAEYHSRISDLEGRLALFHARLAMESAERGREHQATVEEMVYKPLEEVMGRALGRIETEFVRPIMDPKWAVDYNIDNGADVDADANDGNAGHEGDCGDHDHDAANTNNDKTAEEKKDSSDTITTNNNNNATTTKTAPLPNLVTLERRTNLLEAQLNHHQHITLFHAQRHHLDSIEQTFRTTLQPALALETTKADKREGGMVRRFESNAGEYTNSLAQCTSARVASLGWIQHEIDSWEGMDESRAESVLGEIRKLKLMVEEEREVRRREDEVVVEKILRAREMLQEDILALLK